MSIEVTLPAKRCPNCNRDFPAHRGHYRYCLLCPNSRLEFVFDGKPMSDKEIARIKRAAEFERFYMEREAERIRRGEASPEELGSAEAKTELARIRKTNDTRNEPR